ncbi:glycosyltransferase [Winogradskyella sp.]|nr:glycosyltransferase [Winogradskyella sp.]MDB9782669.1 glycosyltransferase [Winogradskyella sp.]MDC1503948.1 glycosyltransferase [Winogradskyella sp.]
MMVSGLVIGIILIYFILIGSLIYGFDKIDAFKLQDLEAKTKFSVIIPFRNEAENLPQLLTSIAKLTYPKSHFEVILVNDDSEDDSIAVIEKLLNKSAFKTIRSSIKIITNKRTTNSPKKDAIKTAINTSQFSWIVTTDADCTLAKHWLYALDESIQINKPNCVVAPVKYDGENSFFNRFQTLDFLSLQGATIGGFGIKHPFMCNGANFAYKKSIFINVDGFKGNDNMASGDDVFLLQKLLKYDSKQVIYLKSTQAIVKTKPVKNLELLIEQRLRWASKTAAYNNSFAKIIGVIVLLANTVCIALIPLALLGWLNLRVVAALIVIKLAIDFLLLFKSSRFFKQETLLLSYVFSSLLYPFFCVYIAIASLFKSYNWKGRTFKM